MIKKNWNPFVELVVILSIILLMFLNIFMIFSNHRTDYSIKIVATDKQTGEPIAGAMVSVYPFFSNKLTNSNGEITFNTRKADDYDVLYSRQGWVGGDYKMDSHNWRNNKIELKMERDKNYNMDMAAVPVIIPKEASQENIPDDSGPGKLIAKTNSQKVSTKNTSKGNDINLIHSTPAFHTASHLLKDKSVRLVNEKERDKNSYENVSTSTNTPSVTSPSVNKKSIVSVNEYGKGNSTLVNSTGPNKISITQGTALFPTGFNTGNVRVNGSNNIVDLVQAGDGGNYSGQIIGNSLLSNGNKISVLQNGMNNYDYKIIDGNNNSLDIQQNGTNQNSYINSSSNNSILSVIQSGFGNISNINQSGSNNKSYIHQQSSQVHYVK